MLYGALTAGSCYVVAAICLKMADLHPESKYEVSRHFGEDVSNFVAKIFPQLGSATTAMFFLYYAFYGTSFAKVGRYWPRQSQYDTYAEPQVPWVYNSEINSLGWRTRGAAAATATNWMASFIVTQFTKVGVQNLGWGFYLREFSDVARGFRRKCTLMMPQCLRVSSILISRSYGPFILKPLNARLKTWTRYSREIREYSYLAIKISRSVQGLVHS